MCYRYCCCHCMRTGRQQLTYTLLLFQQAQLFARSLRVCMYVPRICMSASSGKRSSYKLHASRNSNMQYFTNNKEGKGGPQIRSPSPFSNTYMLVTHYCYFYYNVGMHKVSASLQCCDSVPTFSCSSITYQPQAVV